MALRLLELFLDEAHEAAAREALEELPLLEYWHERLGEGRLHLTALLEAEHAEAVLDTLSARFAHEPGFRLILLPVETTLPRVEPAQDKTQAPEKPGRDRLSRDELYDDVTAAVRLSPVFLVLTGLSTVVAGIGLWRDSVAVVIGAMVIAPLLGPNVGLALATTLADVALARRALVTNAAGVLLASVLAFGLGALLRPSPEVHEIAVRTQVSLSDIALALAAGVAGAMSLTAGLPAALIGVMVAVALLPPLVTFGMLLGSGQVEAAWGALLLLGTNVICVNLAGVVTFWAQGIRPANWWQADRARRATRRALLAWLLLLALLVLFIRFAQQR